MGAVLQQLIPTAARQRAVVARIRRNGGMVITKRVSVTEGARSAVGLGDTISGWLT